MTLAAHWRRRGSGGVLEHGLIALLAIVAVRLLTLRDAARRDGTAPADAPAAALTVLAAKLQRPAECFGSNRAFLRGVAQLVGFLARTSDGEPGWQTLWKGWSVLMTLVEGYELAQTIASAKENVGKTQLSRAHTLRMQGETLSPRRR